MNLIRRLLLALEETNGRQIVIDGYDETQIGYHCYLIVDAGLANGTDVSSLDSPCKDYIATELTWAGHDFLDAAREPDRWEKAQGVFSKMGGVTLEVAKSVLTTLMTQQANRLIGLGE
ncbi:MAG: DUF2513 domain-containing protein [Pirellulaceae bacterium]